MLESEANKKQIPRKIKERGFILLASYLVISALEILSLAIFARSFIFFDATERNQNKIRAFNFAEAGVDDAIRQLTNNASYTGASYSALGNEGGYQISVTTPAADYRLISTIGYAPGNVSTTRASESRNILSYVKLDTTMFNYAVFADTFIVLNGSSVLIDSYDSRVGAYGGSNVHSNGDIASDGIITLNGDPTVNGDILYNPHINCSPGSTNTTSSGSLNISGSTDYVLAAGTYHFDSISVTGNARITTTGPVTVYVDGPVNLGGNGVATAQNSPANFMLIATGNSPIAVSGNGVFYGAIYAPSSAVSDNAGAIHGAVIANQYQHNGNGDIHYDEALGDIPTPCTQVTFLSWHETNTAAS